MDPVIMHDLKRIAETLRQMAKACDKLYEDAEKISGGVPATKLSIMDIKGGNNGTYDAGTNI